MLLLFAVLFGGMVAGRLLPLRALEPLPRIISAIIWLLLFLLGVEVGADPVVARGFPMLGGKAFLLFAGSVAGSIAAAWLLGRWLHWRGVHPEGVPSAEEGSPSLWATLRGSLTIVAFFAVGCLAGVSGLVPFGAEGVRVSGWVLHALMFTVGVSLGGDRQLAARVRRLDPRLALLPVATAVGTLAGAAVVAPVASVAVPDALAVGAGFGYYSLSSIFIADLRSAELGTVALLCNILRELFTLLAAPLVARRAGPLAAISIGGATSFDTTLPVIVRAAGAPYAVVSVFHGCALDFSVPWLVTLFCSLG